MTKNRTNTHRERTVTILVNRSVTLPPEISTSVEEGEAMWAIASEDVGLEQDL